MLIIRLHGWAVDGLVVVEPVLWHTATIKINFLSGQDAAVLCFFVDGQDARPTSGLTAQENVFF